MTDYFTHPQYIPVAITKLSEAEASYSLREAWKRIYGNYPTNNSLALLFSQWALETGRGSFCRNGNFGNIKKVHADHTRNVKDDGHKFTMFRLNEVLNGKIEWFDPPHLQCHMRAYDTVIDGAEDYIKFLSQRKRYQQAWQSVIKGDPHEFSHNLKVAGYYTASESLYTAGVVRLTNEFLKKADKLLAWKPEKPIDVPETKLEDIFTEEERKQILNQIGVGLTISVDEYFANPKRFDDEDDHDYFSTEKKGFWDTIKGKLGL